jgi:lysophospholipase L1-like esterase
MGDAGRSAGSRRRSWLPGWLRAIFFLPAAPKPMAHPDPHHLAESARHMARPPHKSPIDWLAVGPDGGPLDAVGNSRWYEPARPTLSTALAQILGRVLPKEQRRREVLGVLTLLVIASVVSVTGPMAGAGSTPPSPQTEIAAGSIDPSPTPEITVEPTDSPGPTTPDPTAVIAAKPKPAPTRKPAPKPVPVQTFVALGDSLTAWPTTPWPQRLDAEDTAIRLMRNAGVPGNTTAQMRARLTTDVYNYHPNLLFVLGGTNDLGLGISGSVTIANLRAIIVGAKAHNIRVIMLLVPPDSYKSMGPKINSLNAAIINLANSQRVVYVDIHAPLTNGSGTYFPKYTSDGLHFTDLGAQTVANTIRARIRGLRL